MIHVKPRFRNRSAALRWLRETYYPSPHWQKLRMKILKKHPMCQECRKRKAVQVHHRSYDRLWAELDSDLTAICVPCHREIEHEKSKERKARKAAKEQLKTKGNKKTPSFLKKVQRSLLKG